MSIYPSNLEARVSALEHRQYRLEIHTEDLFAGIENKVNQLSDDMRVVKADIKRLSDDMTTVKANIKPLFNNMTASFGQMAEYDVRANMATKEDIATINERLNRLETAFGEHTTLLTQILERLPG